MLETTEHDCRVGHRGTRFPVCEPRSCWVIIALGWVSHLCIYGVLFQGLTATGIMWIKFSNLLALVSRGAVGSGREKV